jgi:hypothetical protein
MSLFESINVEFVAANGPCIANITQEWREINVILWLCKEQEDVFQVERNWTQSETQEQRYLSFLFL